jgi:large subunit ribosomal protein L25
METVKLNAETRDKNGKGAARQMRAKGQVPAVCYGRGSDTIALKISPKELKEAMSGELGVNSIIELQLAGQSIRTMVADYQYHPVSRELLHADFKRIDDSRAVKVDVPLVLVGKAKGIVMGGRLRQVFRKVPISCLPNNIPAKLTFDVTELMIDDLIRVEQLELPEGVEVRLRPVQTLGGVYGSRGGGKGDEDEDEEKKDEEEKK